MLCSLVRLAGCNRRGVLILERILALENNKYYTAEEYSVWEVRE